MKEQFIDCFDLSKTLRFKAIPVGKTQENIEKKRILEEDEKRAEDYKTAKKIIDRYHIAFIDRVLSGFVFNDIEAYADLFFKNNKSDEEKNTMTDLEAAMRKQVSDAFRKDELYNSLFDKSLFSDLLPNFVPQEEKALVKSFDGFTTAFTGFHENRRNMYSEEAQATAISYRIVNENLPKFLSNIRCFEMAQPILEADDVMNIEGSLLGGDYRVEDLFTPAFFNFVLTQRGIDVYNSVIGGIFTESGEKIKGLNECVNLYNQANQDRMPKFNMLYKQVLSDRKSLSFYSEGLTDDEEVKEAVRTVVYENEALTGGIDKLRFIFAALEQYDSQGIYILNGAMITRLSNELYDDWSVFRNAWEAQYDSDNISLAKKKADSYETQKQKEYKRNESFSLQMFYDHCDRITERKHNIFEIVEEKVCDFNLALENAKGCIGRETTIRNNDESIALLKNLLDAIKDIESLMRIFKGTGKEDNRDLEFYGDLLPILETLSGTDALYNAVRNYVTQKPYSKEKFKLYFQTPTFLNGWDVNKEESNHGILLKYNGMIYLGVVDKNNVKCLRSLEEDPQGDNYEKICYRLLPGPNKMLPKVFLCPKWEKEHAVPAEIKRINKEGTFKKGPKFSVTDCHKLIDYYKNCIPIYNDWGKYFDFHFSPTESYSDISGFYREVEEQGYVLKTRKVAVERINALVNEGKLYLFRIYSKDFSEKSHGRQNLHTMYFKAIFSEENDGIIRLNGEAEMFLRRASIKKEKLIIHPAGKPMENKNPNNPKKTTTLEYDVIKDRRYSVDQYEFHVPITINKCPKNAVKTNDKVRELLKNNPNPYVIGIDRGERNLLYVAVIDGTGRIVEQFSLNDILNETAEITIRTDYHELLERKEKERASARQNWTAIENIKELKEGYISQVVHKICELIEKYDAVIALEDLNSGFKNSRAKVEKQVYQKFEKMLIDKLNYMVDKCKSPLECGGVLKGYQLTQKFAGFNKMGTQNGILFYIPAWLTSKIDPTTGFANLLRIKYANVSEARSFIRKFDEISFDWESSMFRFVVNYSNFAYADADWQKKWVLYSNGTRIRIFRNKEKNSEFDYEEVELTAKLAELFNRYCIDFSSGRDIREAICAIEQKEFYVEFFGLLKLMLQMRNSISGRTDVDYLISPVMNSNGKFYDSRDYQNDDSATLPKDADANGAYNIARKVLWAIGQFKEADADSLGKVKIAISNKEWLQYAQTNHIE